MMKDDDIKLLRGFADRLTDKQMDICECRVTFATENGVSQKGLKFKYLFVCILKFQKFILFLKIGMNWTLA